MENNKIKAVKEWKTSTKVKKVENFLEFVNFINDSSRTLVIQLNLSINSRKRMSGNRKTNIKMHLKS